MSCTILEAPNLVRALALAAAQPPRVIILDLDALSPADWGDLRQLTWLCPTAAIVGIGLDETPAHRQRAALAGVATFVSKSLLQSELIPALQALLLSSPEGGHSPQTVRVIPRAYEGDTPR